MGNCSSKISREHVIGNALFEAVMLEVEGVLPMGGEPRTVSKASLTAKILCKHHNSELSVLDEEVASLHRAIRDAREAQDDRQHCVDGGRLERWCLKLLSNLLASGWASKIPLPPGPRIVRQVFGDDPIHKPSGLYLLTEYAGSISPDSVFYSVLSRPPPHFQVYGVLVSLSGLALLLSTCKVDLQELIRESGDFRQFQLHGAVTHYHPPRVQLGDRAKGAGAPRLTLDFAW